MDISEKVLQVFNYEEKSFRPLMSFENWRIAGLNYDSFLDPDAAVYSLEQHLETDEVFVLTEGRAWLLLGGAEKDYVYPEIVEMKIGVVYNVRMFAWHGTLMEKGAKIILVEKKDTGSDEDTLRRNIPTEWRNKIRTQIQ